VNGQKTGSEVEREFEVMPDGFREPLTAALTQKASLVANLLTIKMNNIMPWYHTSHMKAADTTAEHMYSPMVRPGQIVVLTHVSAMNEDHANTTTQIGIERGGEVIKLNRDVQSAVNITIDWDGQVMLSQGDRVKVTFYAATSADDIDISCSGYEIKA